MKTNRYLEFAATATAEELKRAEVEAEARRVSREAPKVLEGELEAIRKHSEPARFPFVGGLTPQ